MIAVARTTAVRVAGIAAAVVAGLTLAMPSAGADSGPSPVYRIYSSQSGEHLFTIDHNEVSVLLGNPIWRAESASFAAVPASGGACATGTIAVQRIVVEATGEHLLISDPHEASALLATLPNFYPEGIALCAYATQVAGTVPVIRLANSVTGLHLWTASQAEVTALNGHGGWRLDSGTNGVAFYAFPA